MTPNPPTLNPAWTSSTRKATRIAQDDQNESFLASRGITPDDPLYRLTARQRMAVQLLATGEPTAQSAERMGILLVSYKELLREAFAAMGLDGDWSAKCARAGFLVGRRGR